MYRIFLLLAFSFSVSTSAYAGGPEASSKINDPARHSEFIERLEEEGITYRVAEDGQVFYPAYEREKVSKIFRSILGVSEPVYKGAIVGYKQASDVSSKLVEERIPFEVFYQGNSVLFKWPEHLNDKATRIVSGVLRDHGV